MTPASDVLFSSDLWQQALERYGRDTHLSVKLFGADERVVFGPIHPTPLFQLFEEKGYDPGIFAECARGCLAQTESRPAVMVSKFYGLAVVGTSLMLEGKTVGAAVAGYAFVDFSQLAEVQRLARDAGIKFEQLWQVAREQKPVPQQRLILNGELLQVLGDALLRENYRTRQYEDTVLKLEEVAKAKEQAHRELQQSTTALRESEGKYRALFEMMAEGFCVIEKVEGEAGERLDFRYVEANPAFTAQTGVGDVVGRTIRQAFPEEPEEWFVTYDAVLRTGEPIWFERGLVTSGSVLELCAFRVEDGTHRRVAVIFKDITERKQAEQATEQTNVELESRVEDRTHDLQNQVLETERAKDSLRDLTGQLLQVQDEERRRLARELHDSAGQTLAALSMNLAAMESAGLDTDRAAKGLADSRLLVDALTKEIRTLSYLLHPPLLDETGLDSALRWYVSGFSERGKIQVDLELDENFGRLSRELETSIFRLIQESLTNIHRHSGSSSARIRLVRSDSQVKLEIADQGKGIPPEKQRELATAKAGVGMRGMQERVRQLGGTFKITSNGKGTCVAVVFPIAHPVAEA
jgi:PAS domain S-box-containing protein